MSESLNVGSNVTKLPSQEAVGGKRSILVAMSERYSMEPAAFEATVRATCFPANPVATREEFAAGMQIAYKLDLNPLTKEVHFARLKGGGVQGIIGVDGWFTMANRHPQYDGCEFENIKDKNGAVTEIICKIYRKDRGRPTVISELMAECRRQSEAWKLTPTRMLRHRAFGQCARIAFSFAGVMDEEEFARWQEMKDVTPKKGAVLPVPDLPDEDTRDHDDRGPEHVLWASGGSVDPDFSALDVNQDPANPPATVVEAVEPIADPVAYLFHLEGQMTDAATQDELDEVWASHTESADGRLSKENQLAAEALFEKHYGRINPKAKKKGA